jgi:type IV secretory pathway VirJ component
MLLSVLLSVAMGSCARRTELAAPETKAVGRFGTVRIFGDSSARDGVVFLFSDAIGWNAAADDAAQRLAKSGLVVVGVDLREYVAGLATSGDGCHYVISEIEALSKELQRERGFPGYRSPILAGFGQGGSLAYAALAQSPAATIAGAAAVAPAPTLFTPVAVCEGAKATPTAGGAFRYAAEAPLPGWWQSDPNDDSPRRLYDLVMSSVRAAAARSEDDVSQLPLIVYPGGAAPNVLAVIYSGDGGWRDLDKQIGEILAKDGIAVIGVDCLRYFWERKTPQQVADDLALIIRTYGTRWGTKQVVLVGYSFGASVLPFAINRLPPDVHDRIVQTSLLALGADAAFQFSVTEWLGAAVDTMPVLPELLQLDRRSLQCFYGEDEKDTLCPSKEIGDAEIVRTSGGHHFDGDYPRLAQRIVDGLGRRGVALAR